VSLQLRILSLGCDENRNVGVGISPNCEKILICQLSFCGVTLHGIGSGEAKVRQCARYEVLHQPSVVNEFLKFRCRCVAVVQHEIGFSPHVD
jgi:hypothetical protein